MFFSNWWYSLNAFSASFLSNIGTYDRVGVRLRARVGVRVRVRVGVRNSVNLNLTNNMVCMKTTLQP